MIFFTHVTDDIRGYFQDLMVSLHEIPIFCLAFPQEFRTLKMEVLYHICGNKRGYSSSAPEFMGVVDAGCFVSHILTDHPLQLDFYPP